MNNQFKNSYHVYLYKYNYDKIKSKIEKNLFNNADGTAYQYLFESFTTDLYSLGVPSDKVLSGVIPEKPYKHYVDQYISTVNKPTSQEKSQTSNSDTVTYTALDTTSISPRIVSNVDNILQQALAQNYALQMLQKDYEDTNMTENAQIHWLNTSKNKEAYQSGISQALKYSKKLLDDIFDAVINDLRNVQKGTATSEYVTCIDLTDLTDASVITKVTNERTKNSCDNFLNSNVANRILAKDIKADALVNINSIQTDIDSIANTALLTLKQDVLLKYNIVLEPNDVIEIASVNINKASDYNTVKDAINKNTQFIGFITKLAASSKYGQVQDISITCEGISKMLSLNPSVSSNAINPQFSDVINFVSGKDKKSDIANVNVYETFYSGKTVYDIYSDIIKDVLGALPIASEEQNYTVHYISSPDQLKKMPYQYCKSLLVLYHMAVSLSTIRECGAGTDIVIAQLDCNVKQTYLEAYLSQLRSQYNLFWSTYVMPIQVLQSIISASFLEIFEDRSGVLIMRTPRYNTWYGNNIIELQDMIEWHQAISDVELKSRSDYQWSIEYYGQMSQLYGGNYQNIPALLKYGFRADSPQSSPNAQSEILCAIFGALNVTKANGKTRELTVTVPAINDYKLGRLYYIQVQNTSEQGIESVGYVGYLSSINTSINPGNVDQHVLTFTYVRSAELIKNPGSNSNYGYILNFTHLPDLEILLSKFNKSMVGSTKDTTKPTTAGLVAYTDRYWAQFNNSTKNLFDAYVSGTVSLGDISDTNYEKFDLNAAPTILSKSSFRKYKGTDNTSYQPSQQLINDIWYIDMLIRCGREINSDLKDGSVSEIHTGVIRTKENEKKFIEFLNKDKTIKNIALPEKLENSYKKTYIAHVNNFLIVESLRPSFVYGINYSEEGYEKFIAYMALFKEALNYIETKFDENDIVKYLTKYYFTDLTKSYGNVAKATIADFKNIIDRQKKILALYDEFNNNIYKFYTLATALNSADCKKDTKAMFAAYKEYTDANASIFEKLKKLLANLTTITMDIFLTDMISELFQNISVKLYKSVEAEVIPAIEIINNNVKDVTHAPLLTYVDDIGTYATGISPVDYTQFFKENVMSKIKAFINAAAVNGAKLLDDPTLRNANSTILGEITGLTIDTNLSSDLYLVCRPTVKLDTETLKKLYSPSEITAITNLTDKAYIVIGPTQIPESKIPTIQQIAYAKGLYASDTEINAASNECIFDPSVLYTWTENELESAITATVYVNIGKDCKDFKDFTGIISNLDKVKCVYNVGISLNNVDNIVFTHDSISSAINNLYAVDKNNRFISIENIEGTTYYRLNDRTILSEIDASNPKIKSKSILVTESYNKKPTTSSSYTSSNRQITYTVNTEASTKILQRAQSSVSGDNAYHYKFDNYVNSRETVVDDIYKHLKNYINYSDGALYPLFIYRKNRDTNEWE